MSSGDGGRPPRTTRRYSGISSSEDGVPWALRRTADFTPLLLPCLLMNVAGDGLHVFERRHRQDAVAEIEDVARPAGGAVEHFVCRREEAVERAEQQGRIEIALD